MSVKLFTQLLVLSVCLAVAQSRQFQNPVFLHDDQPTVMKYNGTYYMIARDDNLSGLNSWLPIYESSDLENWTQISIVFNIDEYPSWAFTLVRVVFSPVLLYKGDTFYVFFQALASVGATILYKFGVAKSKSITGPYVTERRPLEMGLPTDVGVNDPLIIVDNVSGEIYLAWHQDYVLWGKSIDIESLTVSSDAPIKLIEPTFSWEGNITFGSNYVYRNDFYYIFYSANQYCTSNTSIGVARSKFPMGPYEKLERPILNADMTGVWSNNWPNIVKDVDGSSDVIMYHGVVTETCATSTINANTLLWDADNWPYVSFE